MEILANILFYALLGFAGWQLSVFVKEYKQVKQDEDDYRARAETEAEAAGTTLPDDVQIIKLELITSDKRDLILCFDDQNNFIAQGRTISELMKGFHLRLPGYGAVIVDPESKALYQELNDTGLA